MRLRLIERNALAECGLPMPGISYGLGLLPRITPAELPTR